MTEVNEQHIRERLGNLDRIRDLLFGEKIDDYERQFQTYQSRLDKLESEFQQFQSETYNRLTLLQNSLTTEIRSGFDSLDRKIKFVNLTAREKDTKLEREMERIERKNSQNLDYYHQELTAKTNRLADEIERVKGELEASITILKQQTLAEVERDFLALKDTKVSRIDLAEVLFELCLKLRGNELFSRLKEAEEDPLSKLSRDNGNGDLIEQDNEDLQTV